MGRVIFENNVWKVRFENGQAQDCRCVRPGLEKWKNKGTTIWFEAKELIAVSTQRKHVRKIMNLTAKLLTKLIFIILLLSCTNNYYQDPKLMKWRFCDSIEVVIPPEYLLRYMSDLKYFFHLSGYFCLFATFFSLDNDCDTGRPETVGVPAFSQ